MLLSQLSLFSERISRSRALITFAWVFPLRPCVGRPAARVNTVLLPLLQ